jgi:hypothetical protein
MYPRFSQFHALSFLLFASPRSPLSTSTTPPAPQKSAARDPSWEPGK